MNTSNRKLSRSFQKWLLLLIAVAFLITTMFLWMIQTRLALDNTIRLLKLNMLDVHDSIKDASDENLLRLTAQIAEELNETDKIRKELLDELCCRYDVTEINCINSDGIIFASTYPAFLNYDMADGAQSAEFLVLLSGVDEYVQKYQPVSYDGSSSRKYAGVRLERGGFVQVGYGFERFRKDLDQFVTGATRNRHVGESGCLIIADENQNIVSDPNGNEGRNLDVTGILLDTKTMEQGEVFTAEVYGKSCYCMYKIQEGYTIVAVMPRSEAARFRNVAVAVITIMQMIIFAVLFFVIYVLVKKLVVNNILKINGALAAITSGKLDTVVEVCSSKEFTDLSKDINATVDTLKRYIADAEARIDAELAFARTVQYSALPSVFPPFPKRRELKIWASMDTAREVGGDFYDFYFANEEQLIFLIADVSGKGIPAAMFMMKAKALLKSYAESGMSVEEVLTQANLKLCEENEADMFVTVWMGCLDTNTGEVTYANAGHNPPLIRRADGCIEQVKTRPGLVLAGMEGIHYHSYTVCLLPGDILYLYTDGVTEASNHENILYGEERLRSVLAREVSSEVSAVCRLVKADVDAFVGDAPQFDDITMLSLQYNPFGEEVL